MELDQLQMVSGDTDSAATHRDIMKQELDDSQEEVVDFEIDTDHTDFTTTATTTTATTITTTVDPSALGTVIPVDCPKSEKQIIDQTLAQESKQALSGHTTITTTTISNGSAMTVPTSSVAQQQTYLTSGRNTMSNKSLGLFQCGTKLSESRRCRLLERECNELKEVVCSTNHLVLVLDNIRRLSREYILTLYQLVQATILAERSLIDQLHQDCAELESELNHWESKYEFLSSSSSVPNQFVPKSVPPPTSTSSTTATATQQNRRFYFDSCSSPSTIRNVCRKKQSTPSGGGGGFSSDDDNDDDDGGGLVVQPGLDLAQLVMLEQGRRVQEQSQLQRTHQLCSSGSGPGDGGANSSYSHLHQNQANLPMLPSELCEMSMMETINEPNNNNGSCSGFATAASGSGRGSLGTVHSNQADHDSVDPDNDEDEDTAYAHYVDEIRQLEQSQHHQVSRLLSSSSSACSPESMPIVESPNDPNGIIKSSKQQPPSAQLTSSVQASILHPCDSSPLSSSSMASSVAAQQSLGFQNSLGPNENPYLTRDNGTSVHHHHHNNLISGDNLCSQMISAAVAAQRQFKLSMDRLQSDRFSSASADGGQRVLPASASSLTSVSRGQLAGSLTPSLVPSSSSTTTTSSSSKPLFRCEHTGCDYQTNMRQRLAMHRRIHDGEMLYSCDISGCGYQSNYKGNIKIHKKHRHRIEPGSHQSTTYIVNGLRSDHTTTTTTPVAPADPEVVRSNNINKRGRKTRIQPSPNSSGPHNNNNFGGNGEDSLDGGRLLTSGPDTLLNSTMLLASTPGSSEENSAGLSGVGSGSIMSPMTGAGIGATSAYENGCSGNESGQRDGDQYHIFECRYPSCNYRSKWKQCLTAHQLLHIGVKPFKCDFAGCNYRTNFKGNVNVHKRVHRASQFRCKFPGCHFTTPWKNSFTIHQRNHQRNQPEPSPPPTTTTKTSKTISTGKISNNNVVVGQNMLSQTQQSPLCLDRKSHPNQPSFRRATPPLLRAIEQNLLKNNHHHHHNHNQHHHNNNNLVQTKRSKLSGDLSHKQKRSTIVELDHYRHNRHQQQPSPEVEEEEEDDDIVDEDIQLINDEDEDEDQLEHYWNSAPDHNPPNALGGGGGGDFVDFDSQL